MKLTGKQLMAGAHSVMCEQVVNDPYYRGNIKGYSIKAPTENNGWRLCFEGQDMGGLLESDIVLRAQVLSIVIEDDEKAKTLTTAIGFFASSIKCGDAWGPAHEEMMDKARAAIDG